METNHKNFRKFLSVNFKLLHPDATLPHYNKEGDAALDIHPKQPEKLYPGERRLIKVGWAVEIPEDWMGAVHGRSGLAIKGIDVFVGTIDSNFREEVGVLVINNSGKFWEIDVEDRFAQLIIRKVINIVPQWTDELSKTNREGGFGHTGDAGNFKPAIYNPAAHRTEDVHAVYHPSAKNAGEDGLDPDKTPDEYFKHSVNGE